MAVQATLSFNRGSIAISIGFIAILSMVTADSHAGEIMVPEDYETIQAALDAAVDGDVVSVAPGVYPGNVRVESNGVTLRSRTIHGATIQGDGTTNVVEFYQVSGTLEGFIIVGSAFFRSGVRTSQGQHVIRHNVIAGNYWGITTWDESSALIESNQIVGSGTAYPSMAIRTSGGSASIVNNFIARHGVGIAFSTYGGDIINNTIVDNTSYGLYVRLRSPVRKIANNIVAGSQYGIFVYDLFAPDRSAYVGQFLEIDHNLVWNNSVWDYYADLTTIYADGSAISNAGLFDPLPGTSEVHADPLLDSVTEYDLSAGSPAIDAGNNELCPELDLEDALRPSDGNEPPDGLAVCDIGAIEYLPEPGIAATLAAGIALLRLAHWCRTRKSRMG